MFVSISFFNRYPPLLAAFNHLQRSILRYDFRRTSNRDVEAETQTRIYTEPDPTALIPGEGAMTRPSIRVKPNSPLHKLDMGSLLNYAKVYTMEYNVKVCFIGDLSRDSEMKFLQSYHELHPPLQPRISTPFLSSDSATTTSGWSDEPPSPSFGPGRHGYSRRYAVPPAALSQSSMDSVYPNIQQFSNGQRSGDRKSTNEDIAH